MKRIFLVMIFLSFDSISSEFEIDCGNLEKPIDKIVCSDEMLYKKHQALKFQLDIQRLLYENKYNRSTNISERWLSARNLCKTKDCLNAQYTTQLNSVSKSNQDVESYFDCGATTKCTLHNRYYVGKYSGKQVVVDKVQVKECFKRCSQPWFEYYVYELKDNIRDEKTMWHGRFNNIYTRLDHYFEKIQGRIESRESVIEQLTFGADKPGCPDCYKITHKLARTPTGWEIINVD